MLRCHGRKRRLGSPNIPCSGRPSLEPGREARPHLRFGNGRESHLDTDPPRRDTMTVTPHYRLGPDASDAARGEPPHILDAKDTRKLLLQYALLFAVSVVLGVAAYLTDGISQVVLAVLAGIFFAVALWSTLFLTMVRIFETNVERFSRDT
jgi:hypothetical protein